MSRQLYRNPYRPVLQMIVARLRAMSIELMNYVSVITGFSWENEEETCEYMNIANALKDVALTLQEVAMKIERHVMYRQPPMLEVEQR